MTLPTYKREYCPHCGAELPQSYDFCHECGRNKNEVVYRKSDKGKERIDGQK